jgi:hypothetical protein
MIERSLAKRDPHHCIRPSSTVPRPWNDIWFMGEVKGTYILDAEANFTIGKFSATLSPIKISDRTLSIL